MWPFTRKADTSSGADAPTAGPPPIHFDWKEIPAIQRVIPDHPLTVPTEAFADALVTHQDPRAVARPLGHEVRLEAPRGLVLGIAQPHLRHDGPDLVARMRPGRPSPVQRTLPEYLAVSDANETAGDPGFATGTIPEAPPRKLAAQSEPALQRVPLTHVGNDNPPVPLPLRRDVVLAGGVTEAEHSEESPEPLPAYPRLTLGQARRLGLGAPLSRVPDTAIQRAVDRPAAPPPSSTPTSNEPTFSPIFPLDFPSPKPVVAPAPISRRQRIPTTLPLAQPPAVTTEGAVDETQPIEPHPAQTTRQTSIAPLAGSQPVATTGDPRTTMLDEPVKGEREGIDDQRRPLPLTGPGSTSMPDETVVDVSPAVAPASQATDVARAGIERTPELAGRAAASMAGPVDVAPLLSERPLKVALQRAPDGSVSSSPSRLADSPARSASGVRIDVPRSPGPLSTIPTGSLLPGEFLHPGQQRQTATGLQFASGAARKTEAEVQRAVSDAELPLRSGSPFVHSSSVTIDGPGLATGMNTVQRASEPNISGPTRSDAPAMTAGEPVASESPTQAKNDETHLNELAAKLYDRIRSRLRNELLVDRERAGFLTDLR